jgi:hypothetical protein
VIRGLMRMAAGEDFCGYLGEGPTVKMEKSPKGAPALPHRGRGDAAAGRMPQGRRASPTRPKPAAAALAVVALHTGMRRGGSSGSSGAGRFQPWRDPAGEDQGRAPAGDPDEPGPSTMPYRPCPRRASASSRARTGPRSTMPSLGPRSMTSPSTGSGTPSRPGSL